MCQGAAFFSACSSCYPPHTGELTGASHSGEACDHDALRIGSVAAKLIQCTSLLFQSRAGIRRGRTTCILRELEGETTIIRLPGYGEK